MFNLPNRQPKQNGDAETRQPLLEEEHPDDPVLFSVEDDDEEHEEQPKKDRTRSVRFQEDVRIIGPPLRSTIQSREARTPHLTSSPSAETNMGVVARI